MDTAIVSLPVGGLITSREAIPPQTRVDAVADRFFNARDLEALAVVEDRQPLALATRGKVLSILFNRFGFELFGRDPIIEIADRSPLIVHASTTIDAALDQAMRRSFEDIYDEILVIDDHRRFLGFLSVKRLVLEQGNLLAHSVVEREVAVARTREMERISEMKSQFIAHVTHELRSPVNAIIGLSELMQAAIERGSAEAVAEKMPTLLASAVSLRAIITNILDLSKIEAGRMEIHRESFDLVPLLHEVAETTRILARGKEVAVVIEVPPATEALPIFSDVIKLRQILVNLASNAAKFTERGQITLAARRTATETFVDVRDSGIGIRPEDLERLFAPFTQLEDAKTKRHGGTGLGLAITREFMHLLGGRITVASTYGEGTTFTVCLPHIPPQEGELQ